MPDAPVSISHPLLRTPERIRPLARLRTLHDLRLSVARRRPISLPNLLRLHRRRLPHTLSAAVDAAILRGIYLQHQPFTAGAASLRWPR